MKQNTFSRKESLKKSGSIKAVLDKGICHKSKSINVYILKRPGVDINPDFARLLRKQAKSARRADRLNPIGFNPTRIGLPNPTRVDLPKPLGEGSNPLKEGPNAQFGINKAAFICKKALHQKKSVLRNRVRRILKEAYRQTRRILPAGHDIVIVGTKITQDTLSTEIEREILDVFKKHIKK